MPCNEGGDHIRRSREFYVFGKLGVLGSGESGVAWEGRALARPLHRAGARRSREFYVFGKLGVLGSGESGVAWEGRALARPRHRAGARRSQEARRSREFNVTGRVFRGLPGRDEHWLVRVIELVLDVPRKRDEEARRSPVVAFSQTIRRSCGSRSSAWAAALPAGVRGCPWAGRCGHSGTAAPSPAPSVSRGSSTAGSVPCPAGRWSWT